MFFRLSHPPLGFEIPNDWLKEANAIDFRSYGQCYEYTSSEEVIIIPLQEISPLLRNPGIEIDYNGFRRQYALDGTLGGMIGVLKGIVEKISLPPVCIRLCKEQSSEGFKYVILDGCHRYYASYALGFTHLPCIIGDNGLSDDRFGDRRGFE